MEVIIDCPLGSECEHIVQDKMHRCAWYTKLQGKNPQDGTDVDEWGCAMSWMPMLMCEHTKEAKGAVAATESLRNAVSETGNVLVSLANKNRLQAIGD